MRPKILKHLAYKLVAAYRFKYWLRMNVGSSLQVSSTLFYSYWFDAAALGLSIYSKKKPIHFISRAHGYDLYDERSPIGYLPFRSLMLKQAHSVFSVSEDGKNYLKAKHPEFANKISVSRLGVKDPGCTTPASNDGILRIASCSFIVPVKRLPLLIKGLSILGQKRPTQRIHWDHIGSGPQEDELIQLASETLPNNVIPSFHGHLTNQSVLDFYRSNPIDVFINVSESEGIPVSIMEAQSFGIPVVATSVGGVPEIVNNDNGILLPENPSPADIASALEVFNEPDATLETRKESKNNWHAHFNASRNYSAFMEQLVSVPNDLHTGISDLQPETHV